MPNANLSVTLTPELRLEQALTVAGIENPASVTQLTVVGTLVEDDLRYISENMAETLQELDMGHTTIGRNIIANHLSCCYDLTAIKVHPDNTAYASEESILFSKDKTILVAYPRGRGRDDYDYDYAIPDSVIIIGRSAFSGCSYLLFVTIPDTVVKIEEGAFYDCLYLQSIDIPDSVREIESWAFGGCYGLTTAIIPQSVEKIGENVFSGCVFLENN